MQAAGNHVCNRRQRFLVGSFPRSEGAKRLDSEAAAVGRLRPTRCSNAPGIGTGLADVAWRSTAAVASAGETQRDVMTPVSREGRIWRCALLHRPAVVEVIQ